MFKKIRAIATDVDGVLTDGTFWWSTSGEEMKRFCFADVTGIALARKAAIPIALISGESSPAARILVERFAAKLQISDFYAGCQDKAAATREFAANYDLDLSAICFIGDDVPDLPAMTIAGLAVAPANAQRAALDAAHYVTAAHGGSGVLREVIERIIAERNQV